MTNAVLRVDNLVKRFGSTTAVNGVSFNVLKGRVFGLLGSNGAGKSTTFKMIMGLLKPDGGEVFLDGEAIGKLPMYKRARKGLGYLAQDPAVFASFTVEENISALLEARGYSSKSSRQIASEFLEEFNLSYLIGRKAEKLSGGERRRLEIARTLSFKPSILLLDEPFSGIDPKSVDEIQGFIRGLSSRGLAILLTDHNVRETFEITDSACIIEKGTVVASGIPEDLVKNQKVRDTYLGENFRM